MNTITRSRLGVRNAGKAITVAIGICGDGVLDPEVEDCDDGNQVAGDGCEPTCTVSSSSTS